MDILLYRINNVGHAGQIKGKFFNGYTAVQNKQDVGYAGQIKGKFLNGYITGYNKQNVGHAGQIKGNFLKWIYCCIEQTKCRTRWTNIG